MTITTSPADLKSLAEAIEADDPARIAAVYAQDAVIEVFNRDHGPADPIIVRGRDAVRALLEDVAGRKLTHRVERAVADGAAGALQVGCRYPDGSRVTCMSTFDTEDGLIVRETRLEVWDD